MSEPSYTFQDARLKSVPLRALNLAGRGLEAFGLPIPKLSVETIVSAAERQAGVENVTHDSYREPLERYLRAVDDEAELSAFGRLAVRTMLVSSIASRIRLAHWAHTHPEVEEEVIDQPWVILGLPRTGTSLLSILLALDPTSRTLLHWEGSDPIPPPTIASGGEDPRIAKTARELAQLLKLNPALAAMHPFGATIAQECVALFMYDIRTLGVETQAFVPGYGRWLETCDMAPAYAQHKLALQALQHAAPTGRWVMKTPNHLWCIDTLMDFYPDARVIWTHRDPGIVATSLSSLVNALQGMFTHRRDPKPVAEEWLAKTRHALESGMKSDAERPSDWCQHVRYVDLVKDPIGTVQRIYAVHGETVSPLHQRRMEAWLREDSRETIGRHVYDPKDFGWTYDDLAEKFVDYRERYHIPRE